MGNPLQIFILSFSTLNWGNFDSRISDSRAMIGLVDILWRSPDPEWYTHVWFLLRGNPLQILFCTFHDGIGRGFRWHEASSSWWAQVQALSKWYTRVWTQKRGYPLQNFILHVSILNWGDEDAVGLLDFWNDMWIAFANPADVYFLHLSCRDILNKTSILSVVGGSAGVSLS